MPQQRAFALSRLEQCARSKTMRPWSVGGFEGEVFTKSIDTNRKAIFTASIQSSLNADKSHCIIIEPTLSVVDNCFEAVLLKLLFPGTPPHQISASARYRYGPLYLVLLDALCKDGYPKFQELCTEADIQHRVDVCISNFIEFGLPFLDDHSTIGSLSAVILGSGEDSPPLIFSDWSLPVVAFMAGDFNFARARLQERFLDPSWADSLLPGLNLSRGEFAHRFETLLARQ